MSITNNTFELEEGGSTKRQKEVSEAPNPTLLHFLIEVRTFFAENPDC